MTDFTRGVATPIFISSWSRYCSVMDVSRSSGNLSLVLAAWPAANTAIYMPFWLPWPYPVRRMFWVNGSAVAGNWDIGIYTTSLKLLYSAGSTAMSGASVPQYVSPSSPLLLDGGSYYLGVVHSATTANHAQGASPSLVKVRQAGGILHQASALPLPDPMVPATPTGTGLLPLCGFTRTASGF